MVFMIYAPLLSYYIVVWRRTAFYMVNYVLPALLINIISLFVFAMPSESGEKITLGRHVYRQCLLL